MLSKSSVYQCYCAFFLAGGYCVDAAAGGVLDAGDAGRDPHPRVLAIHHRRVHRDTTYVTSANILKFIDPFLTFIARLWQMFWTHTHL